MNLIEAEELNCASSGAHLLSQQTFTIGLGLSVILGGDGRGKTTLLGLMSGINEPTSGVIRRLASSTFHENPADPRHDETIAQAWLAALRPSYPSWDADLQAELIEGFDLTEHIGKPLYMLSTGSRRKVGLVGAAASRAQLTLVDMPFVALDGSSRRLVSQLLAEAAESETRAWVIADYELPSGVASEDLAGVIDLGD